MSFPQTLLNLAYENSPYFGSGIAHHIPTLYGLALDTCAQHISNLGIGGGASTLAFLAATTQTGGEVVAIDIDADATGLALIRGLAEVVITDALAYHPLVLQDIIFIDDNHEAPHVLAELEYFRQYLSEQGLIVMHDTNWFGPREARDAMLKQGVMELVAEDRASWGLSILRYV